jgi:uncharacterized protein with beta-barrel porin domain
VEAGYGLNLDDAYGLTPFAAFAAESIETPAYAETAVSGSANFALAYTARTSDISHLELGTRLGRAFRLDADTLAVEATAAWAHQLAHDALAQAAFTSLPGSAFTILGVKPARDSALLGLALESRADSGFSYNLQVQGQMGPGTGIVSGTAGLAFRW